MRSTKRADAHRHSGAVTLALDGTRVWLWPMLRLGEEECFAMDPEFLLGKRAARFQDASQRVLKVRGGNRVDRRPLAWAQRCTTTSIAPCHCGVQAPSSMHIAFNGEQYRSPILVNYGTNGTRYE